MTNSAEQQQGTFQDEICSEVLGAIEQLVS